MRLRWSGAALDDLDRIAMFNEQRSDQWARRVNERIIERAESLLRSPLQGRPVRGSEIRALSIPDVQYVVSYEINDGDIRVVRVRSTREIRNAR